MVRTHGTSVSHYVRSRLLVTSLAPFRRKDRVEDYLNHDPDQEASENAKLEITHV